MVCPWQPMRSILPVAARRTARAYNSPSSKFRREISAVWVIALETASRLRRTSAGYGTERKFSVRMAGISTMATSIPSSEVPLMIPATRTGAHFPFLLQLLLQVGQQLQRLDGTQLIEVHA